MRPAFTARGLLFSGKARDLTRLLGRLAPPPSLLFQLGPDAPGPIRQNIQLDAFAAEWRLTLLPMSVQQTAPPETAVDRVPTRPCEGKI